MHQKRMVQCMHVGSAWRNQQGLMKGVTLKEDLGNSKNITHVQRWERGSGEIFLSIRDTVQRSACLRDPTVVNQSFQSVRVNYA